jgi:hypothetical protein
MNNSIGFELIMGELSKEMDKPYFKVSAKNRDRIAKMVMIKDLWDTPNFDMELPIYMEYILMKIQEYEYCENYEAADFYKRIKKHIIKN